MHFMKKILIALAITGCVLSAFAQGKIALANDPSRLFVLQEPLLPGDIAGPIPQSPLPSGHTIVASLYGATGTEVSALSLVTSIPLTAAYYPGQMKPAPVIMPDIPGGTVATLAIVLTDIAAGAWPASVSISGGFDRELFPDAIYFGTSGLFTAIPGFTLAYPPIYLATGPVYSTWAPGDICISAPEPSSLALAVTAGALFMIRRRR